MCKIYPIRDDGIEASIEEIKKEIDQIFLRAIHAGTLEKLVINCPNCKKVIVGYWDSSMMESPYPCSIACRGCGCSIRKEGPDG